MAFTIQRVDYYYSTVKDLPGEGYKLLSHLAALGINLLAFSGVPQGPMRTQFTLFPEDTSKFLDAAKKSNLTLDGPHAALLVQGDDELGAFAGIHMKLFEANVNVYASGGVTDGRGSFGYVIYVRPEECDRAVKALGM